MDPQVSMKLNLVSPTTVVYAVAFADVVAVAVAVAVVVSMIRALAVANLPPMPLLLLPFLLPELLFLLLCSCVHIRAPASAQRHHLWTTSWRERGVVTGFEELGKGYALRREKQNTGVYLVFS